MYFQVEKFGKPTWKRLVEAVEDKVGGNNPALAQKIAKDHSSSSNTKCECVFLVSSKSSCNWHVLYSHLEDKLI